MFPWNAKCYWYWIFLFISSEAVDSNLNYLSSSVLAKICQQKKVLSNDAIIKAPEYFAGYGPVVDIVKINSNFYFLLLSFFRLTFKLMQNMDTVDK